MFIPATVNDFVPRTSETGCSPLHPSLGDMAVLLTLFTFLIVTVSFFCNLCGSSVVNVRVLELYVAFLIILTFLS